MHFLNSVKRKFSLSRQAQAYLPKYHITYKKVLKEARKKEIMIGILKRQQTKQKIRQLINKQVGKHSSMDKKIELKTEIGTVTNPQKVAEVLNAYIVETVEEIIKQNNYPSNTLIAQSKIEYCPTQYSCYLLLKMK